MTGSSTPNDFGKQLNYYRNRTIGENGKALSQFVLAEKMCEVEGITVSRNHIYKWENGKSQIRPDDRKTLLVIVKVLVKYQGIKTISEANQLINAAGLKSLDPHEFSQINLIDPVQSFVDETIASSQQFQSDKSQKNLGIGDKSVPSSPVHAAKYKPEKGNSGGGRGHEDPINFSSGDVFFNRPMNYPEKAQSYLSVKENFSTYQVSNSTIRTGLAPALPAIFVGRENDLQELKKRLAVNETNQKHNLQVLTAVRGWPGVGKTTTAAALAYETDVIEKYPDGILWISLGPKPDILADLILWGKVLGLNDIHKVRNIAQASAILAAYLRDKRMLLIIDDVWDAADASPFELGGYGCAILATTRLPAIAAKMVGSPEQIYLLRVLTDEDALDLMRKLAPDIVAEHKDEIENLIKNLEGLPLALQVAGKLLQTEHSTGFGVDELIQEISVGKRLLNEKVPLGQENLTSATTPSIAALLYKSIDHLDSKTREYYAQLGVVAPSPAKFDLNFMGEIWKVSNPKPIVQCLVDRGLLEYLPQSKQYQMHSLLVMLANSLWFGDEAKRLSSKTG